MKLWTVVVSIEIHPYSPSLHSLVIMFSHLNTFLGSGKPKQKFLFQFSLFLGTMICERYFSSIACCFVEEKQFVKKKLKLEIFSTINVLDMINVCTLLVYHCEISHMKIYMWNFKHFKITCGILHVIHKHQVLTCEISHISKSHVETSQSVNSYWILTSYTGMFSKTVRNADRLSQFRVELFFK